MAINMTAIFKMAGLMVMESKLKQMAIVTKEILLVGGGKARGWKFCIMAISMREIF